MGAKRPHQIVDEQVDLFVGPRPVPVPSFVCDVAVERRDRRIDQPSHLMSLSGFWLGLSYVAFFGACSADIVRLAEARRDEMAMRVGPVPTRYGDVELGIAPHAVFGHVQSRSLDVLFHSDAPETLHRPETAERRGERERADC